VTVILDASALLTLLNDETGADRVATAVATGGVISAVNLSEVVAKLSDWGMPEATIHEVLGGLGLRVIPFGEALAYTAGRLHPATKEHGLSLGDRACLALGLQEKLPVLTGDRSWEGPVADVTLEWIR